MITSNPQALFNLNGKKALITGAGGGIGAVIAKLFAAAGAHVYVHYRQSKIGAQKVADQITVEGGSASLLSGDLTRRQDVERLFHQAGTTSGHPDILINNVGAYPNADILTMTDDEWRHMFATNMDSVFLCTQYAAQAMKDAGQGVIINIGSIAGSIPGPAHSHYNSAKAAVEMYTRSAAQELGQYGIRVNCVSPGLINRADLADVWPEGVKAWQDKAPLTRVGEAEDVANACLFFASDAASWISGQILLVDGGMSAATIY